MYDSLDNLGRIKIVGKGAFGEVYKYFDYKLQKKIAVKIINDEPRFLEAAKREINFLKIIKISNMEDYPVINMLGDFVHLNRQYILFDYLSIDLYKFYRKYPEEIDLDMGIYMFYNIAKGLKFIHSLNIIHADLKPENIMIGYCRKYRDVRRYKIKIVDFGSSLSNNIYLKKYHFYIQSRYYRAPEVLYRLNVGTYIDIWSLGCVFYEILFKKPLFSGKNELDMIYLICQKMNIPYKKKNYSNSQYFYKLFIYDYVCNRYKFKLDDEIKYDKYKINLNEYLYKQFITISKNRFKIKKCVSILKKILTYNYFDRIKGEDIIYDKLFLELKLKGIVK